MLKRLEFLAILKNAPSECITGTVNIISSNPSCKRRRVQFTMVPL